MAQQTVEATDNLNEGREKINENFTEIYGREIAGLMFTSDITTAQLLEALSIPGRIAIYADCDNGIILTNMTSALASFPLGDTFNYTRVCSTNIRRMRLCARITVTSASVNNPRMYIQYSLDSGGNWTTLGAGTIASGEVISLFTGAVNSQSSGWITLPAEARGDNVLFRVVTEGGDGAADPIVGNVSIEYTT